MLPKPPQVLPAWNLKSGARLTPVRMYMREMGTVELLTREGESASLSVLKTDQPGFNAPLLNIRKRSPIC